MENNDTTLYATMRPARGGKSFVTLSTYGERQEALKRTTMMEDDVNHRASRNFTAVATNDKLTLVNGSDISGQQNGQQQNGQQINVPPPPPQFANSPSRLSHTPNSNNNNNYTATQQQKSHSNTSASTTRQQLPTTSGHKPPSSPVPDYDNVQIRSTSITTTTATRSSAYGYASTNLVTNSRESTTTASNATTGNRRTMRLGTVTIGEYDQQRKEPAKFDFITTTTAAANNEDAQNPKNLQAELQNTLTRSNNLKKSKGHHQQQQQQQSSSSMEHQSNCPLQNNYDDYEFTKNANHNNSTTTNVDNLTRKLQGASVTNRTSKMIEVAPPLMRNSNGSNNGNGNGNGILKNGSSSRNSGSSFTKSSTEKTITFGN